MNNANREQYRDQRTNNELCIRLNSRTMICLVKGIKIQGMLLEGALCDMFSGHHNIDSLHGEGCAFPSKPTLSIHWNMA